MRVALQAGSPQTGDALATAIAKLTQPEGGKIMKQFLTAAALACIPAYSSAETVVVAAKGSVSEAIEKLKTAVENAGARVFILSISARVCEASAKTSASCNW
jgi:hypothetical protein